MASIKFYINKSKDRWTSEETLFAQFTHSFGKGDSRRIKIFPHEPLRLDPAKWNVKTQKVMSKSSSALKLQQQINEEHERIQKAWEELEREWAGLGSSPSLQDLGERLKGVEPAKSSNSCDSLYDLIDLYMEEKRLSYAKATVDFYQTLSFRVLRAFEEKSRQSFRVEHLDLTFFNRFKAYCIGNGCLNQTTNVYLDKIVAVLRWHYRKGAEQIRSRVNADFMRVEKLPTSRKGERDHISEEEALFLFRLRLPPFQSVIRDTYLFMVFTGPRIGDTLSSLRKETNIREIADPDGSVQRVLRYTQKKVKGVEEVMVPLNRICEEIIHRNNPGDFGPIFLTTPKWNFNRHLKKIFKPLRAFGGYMQRHGEAFLGGAQCPEEVRKAAQWLGLEGADTGHRPQLQASLKVIERLMRKRESVDYVGSERRSEVYERWEKLTAHTGRHSFGSLLADKGATLKEAQTMMGHSNSNTTAKYYHIDQEKTVHKVSAMLAVPVMKVG